MAETINLPPLPEGSPEGPGETPEEMARFLPEEMREYAHQAVLAERERCARLCETMDHGAFGPASYLAGVKDGAAGCAARIRKG